MAHIWAETCRYIVTVLLSRIQLCSTVHVIHKIHCYWGIQFTVNGFFLHCRQFGWKRLEDRCKVFCEVRGFCWSVRVQVLRFVCIGGIWCRGCFSLRVAFHKEQSVASVGVSSWRWFWILSFLRVCNRRFNSFASLW